MTRRLRLALVLATLLPWAAISSPASAQVVVNEIHLRPSRSAVFDGEDPSRAAFIELYNSGPTSVDLSGWSFASATPLVFPDGISLAASEFLLVAADPAFQRERIPSIPAGVTILAGDIAGLAGAGIRLLDRAHGVVDDVSWVRPESWPSEANGRGPSLELLGPRADNGSPRAWRPSVGVDGTPGTANSTLDQPFVVSEFPVRGRSAEGAREIAVTFSEPIKHVRASDLTVDGIPAFRVSGTGAGPYVFAIRPPRDSVVTVELGGPIETADDRTFAGDSWQYLAFAPAVLSLPDGANGGVGATVQVPISVAPGDGIFGIDMTLQYNAAIVQAQDVTVSGIAATAGFGLVRNLNTAGTIIISTYATQNALTGSGEIARIQFLVVGAPGAKTNLTFTSASINEGGIPATPDPGLFTVTCATSANGTACSDGDACTANETCQSGACTGGTPLQVPAEIANLAFGADEATITWTSAAQAGPGTVHDVVRGLVGQFPVGAGAGESCFATGIAAATVSDAAIPPAASTYWYLVRGRNACAVGTYGFRATNGTPGAQSTTSICP